MANLGNLWFAINGGEYLAPGELPSVMGVAGSPLGLVEKLRPYIEADAIFTQRDKQRLLAEIEKVGLGASAEIRLVVEVEPAFSFICQHGVVDLLGN